MKNQYQRCHLQCYRAKFAKMGLAVNEYMLSTRGDIQSLWFHVPSNYPFDVVEEFIYVGTTFNRNNDISLEIKRRVTLPIDDVVA